MRRSLWKPNGVSDAVVGAALREAGAEQPRVRQQVRGHERAVAVAADADAIAIGDAHLDHLVDRRLRARHQLLDVVSFAVSPGPTIGIVGLSKIA